MYGFHDNVPEAILQLLNNCIWSKYLEDFRVTITSRKEVIYYNNNICINMEKAKKIFVCTLKQNSTTWYKERSQRITGSICYYLFTSMKSGHNEIERNEKLQSTYKSKFKGNEHTLRGQEGKTKAEAAYTKLTGFEVQQMGLIILKTTPWFGFSADGVANNLLIEIKCPKNPDNLSAENLLKTLPYITLEKGEPQLKARHQYYGQVQLRMALLQFDECHFVVYESCNDSCAIVPVPRVDNFIKQLLQTLTQCYFKHILPWLINEKNDQENIKMDK